MDVPHLDDLKQDAMEKERMVVVVRRSSVKSSHVDLVKVEFRGSD